MGKAALQDTWRAMEDLKKFGVVKAIGVSDYNVSSLQDTLEIATQPIELNQVMWNPRVHDEELLAFAKKNKILLQAWSPLGGSAGSVLSDPKLKQVAAAHNTSSPQVALKWALQRGVAVVVGTDNPDHAKGDMDLFNFELTDSELMDINGIQSREPATSWELAY